MTKTFRFSKVRNQALAVALLIGAADAQWTYPGCDNVTDADFTVTTMVSRGLNDPSILEPVKMAFAMNADGTVDIYYVQRKGEVKRYDGRTKSVSTLATLPVETGNEDGLVGIAVDPKFATNNRIFLFYSHSSGYRVSRFTLAASDKKLDPASEKVLLTIPSGRGRWHTSGAMQFDAYGDLWINVGDNETLYTGPANTADHRGGILRIHPEENGGYSIPKGNMWEFAAAYFRGKGQNAVAEKYLDSAKMRREIFVKGARNPYTLTLDPVRRWATYGDCGPDQESKTTSDRTKWTEEHNVVTAPSFRGWPFWSADQKFQTAAPYGKERAEKDAWPPTGMDPASPINKFGGIAIPELMPADPGTHVYAHNCAMTGPIFRYDGSLPGKDQLPPHFNRLWFITDFNMHQIRAVKLDEQGRKVGEAVDVFKGLGDNLRKPLDFQQGPDGALYYLSYSCGPWRQADACSGIYRISYTGSCRDPSLFPEATVASGRNLRPSLLRALDYDIRADAFLVSAAGPHSLEAFSLEGRPVFRKEGLGPGRYPALQVLRSQPPGLYLVRLATSEGYSTWTYPHVQPAGR